MFSECECVRRSFTGQVANALGGTDDHAGTESNRTDRCGNRKASLRPPCARPRVQGPRAKAEYAGRLPRVLRAEEGRRGVYRTKHRESMEQPLLPLTQRARPQEAAPVSNFNTYLVERAAAVL